MMMKPLHKEVSQSEMLTMRDEGMSNEEIASHLGVSYQTVLRYIGKQPKSIKRSPREGTEESRREQKQATSKRVLAPSLSLIRPHESPSGCPGHDEDQPQRGSPDDPRQ